MSRKTEIQIPPRVFIIQQPKPKIDGWVPSFDTAAKYGGLHFVFEQSDRAHLDPSLAIRKVSEALDDFNPDQDYLLPTIFGDPATTWVSICWLVPLLLDKGFKFLTFLYWNRGKGEEGMTNANGYYSPCKIPLDFP